MGLINIIRHDLLCSAFDLSKATKAAEEEMEDTMLYDGDQQRYLQLLANGGEEEVGIDASDIDSSDVASSNDIDSSDDDSDAEGGGVGYGDGDGALKNARNKLVSSVARSSGRGKRGRAEMGQSAMEEEKVGDRTNPLLAEIGSKSERRQAAAQRWFDDPLFAGVDETLAENDGGVDGGNDGEVGDGDGRDPPTKRSRRGGEGGDKGGRSGEDGKEKGAAEALMAAMPKTEKEKRKEKRKKVSIPHTAVEYRRSRFVVGLTLCKFVIMHMEF